MELDELKDQWDKLAFTIQLNANYHNRRRNFFDTLNTAFSFIIVLAGSGTVLSLLQQWGDVATGAIGLLVTVVSSMNLVVGTARKARLHDILFRSYIDLHVRWHRVLTPTKEDYLLLNTDLVTLGKDEPPENRTLLEICYNEESKAMGGDREVENIAWWQRALAQFIDFRDPKHASPERS